MGGSIEACLAYAKSFASKETEVLCQVFGGRKGIFVAGYVLVWY